MFHVNFNYVVVNNYLAKQSNRHVPALAPHGQFWQTIMVSVSLEPPREVTPPFIAPLSPRFVCFGSYRDLSVHIVIYSVLEWSVMSSSYGIARKSQSISSTPSQGERWGQRRGESAARRFWDQRRNNNACNKPTGSSGIYGRCWMPLSAVCNGSPTKPDHGAFTSCRATSLPGASCVATCHDGYTAGSEGAPLAVCNDTGSWGPVTGDCTLIGECS